MGNAAPATSLSNANAAQWNRDLMLEFQAALEKNPAADLMSMFSDSYLHEHRNAQYRQLSYAANINFRVLDELYDTLRHEPEVNLLSVFPKKLFSQDQNGDWTKTCVRQSRRLRERVLLSSEHVLILQRLLRLPTHYLRRWSLCLHSVQEEG